MSAPAFESPGAAEGTEDALSAPIPAAPAPEDGDAHEARSARLAAVAAGVLIVGTLLPWVSVTFFNSSTLAGVRLPEGKWALAFAFLTGLCAITAIVLPDRRRELLRSVAALSVLALIPILEYPFRYRDTLDLSGLGDNAQVQKVAKVGLGIESGWYLSLLAAIALVLISLWGVMGHRSRPGSE